MVFSVHGTSTKYTYVLYALYYIWSMVVYLHILHILYLTFFKRYLYLRTLYAYALLNTITFYYTCSFISVAGKPSQKIVLETMHEWRYGGFLVPPDQTLYKPLHESKSVSCWCFFVSSHPPFFFVQQTFLTNGKC